MRSLLAAATLTALLLLAPGAAADSEAASIFEGQPQDVLIEVGPDFLDISVEDITLPGELAREARRAIDQSPLADDGVPDGTISRAEVRRVEALAKGFANAEFEDEPLAFITIDGRPATSTLVTRVDVEGLAGSVESTNPIVTDVTLRVRFADVDTDLAAHTVRLEQLYGDFAGSYDAAHFPPVTVTVQGKNPWSLVTDSVSPSEFEDNVDGDALVFTGDDVQAFDETGEYLEFEVAGDPEADFSRNSPGVGVLGLVAALGVALLVARRR